MVRADLGVALACVVLTVPGCGEPGDDVAYAPGPGTGLGNGPDGGGGYGDAGVGESGSSSGRHTATFDPLEVYVFGNSRFYQCELGPECIIPLLVDPDHMDRAITVSDPLAIASTGILWYYDKFFSRYRELRCGDCGFPVYKSQPHHPTKDPIIRGSCPGGFAGFLHAGDGGWYFDCFEDGVYKGNGEVFGNAFPAAALSDDLVLATRDGAPYLYSTDPALPGVLVHGVPPWSTLVTWRPHSEGFSVVILESMESGAVRSLWHVLPDGSGREVGTLPWPDGEMSYTARERYGHKLDGHDRYYFATTYQLDGVEYRRAYRSAPGEDQPELLFDEANPTGHLQHLVGFVTGSTVVDYEAVALPPVDETPDTLDPARVFVTKHFDSQIAIADPHGVEPGLGALPYDAETPMIRPGDGRVVYRRNGRLHEFHCDGRCRVPIAVADEPGHIGEDTPVPTPACDQVAWHKFGSDGILYYGCQGSAPGTFHDGMGQTLVIEGQPLSFHADGVALAWHGGALWLSPVAGGSGATELAGLPGDQPVCVRATATGFSLAYREDAEAPVVLYRVAAADGAVTHVGEYPGAPTYRVALDAEERLYHISRSGEVSAATIGGEVETLTVLPAASPGEHALRTGHLLTGF